MAADRIPLWLPHHPPGFHDRLARELGEVETLAATDIQAARDRFTVIRPQLLLVVGGKPMVRQVEQALEEGTRVSLYPVRGALDARGQRRTGVMLRIFGVVGVLAGFVGSPVLISTTLDARASATWPTTPGRIDKVEVEHYTSSSRSSGTSRRRWEVMIRYRYTVAGRERTSGRVKWVAKETYGKKADAMAAAARYRDHRAVTVYYDPTDPASTVLRPGPSTDSEIAPYIMLVLGAVGLFLLLGRLRTLRLRIIASAVPPVVVGVLERLLVG